MATETVFSYLVNKAAFVDGITLSVWTQGKPIMEELVEVKPKPILIPKSLYARYLSGQSPLTGNPVEIRYGKVSRFPRVPDCQVRMRSENVPLTGSQVNETMLQIFPKATTIKPVLVELTFDLRNISVARLQQNMMHRARQWTELKDGDGKKTVYVGSVKSQVEIRIYDKTERIVRLEFILRRGFLDKIERPDNVIALRNLRLRPYFSLRRFSRSRIEMATQDWEQYWRDGALDWEYDRRPLHLLSRMMGCTGDQDYRLFPLSRRQRVLDNMQGNLLW